MEHLDAKSLEALLRREPEAMAHFQAHLANPCAACEQFLVDEPRLDGVVDTLLLGLSPPAPAALDEVGFARLKRALRPARSSAGLAAAGLAAGLLIAVSVGQLRPGARDDDPVGLKGRIRIQLDLRGAVRGADGQVTRVDPDQLLAPSGVLLLRYHATEAGAGQLLVQRGNAPAEALGAFALEPGTHDLSVADEVKGFSLAGENGELTLWLVATPGVEPPSLGLAKKVAAGVEPGSAAVGRLHLRVGSTLR
jgi:hypothetical protein